MLDLPLRGCSYEKNDPTWAGKWFKPDIAKILVSSNKNRKLWRWDAKTWEHTIAENNKVTKNEPQLMRVWRKTKFCLILSECLSEKYKSLLVSKI